MEIQFQEGDYQQWQADILLAPTLEDGFALDQYPELDAACPWLAVAPAMRDVRHSQGELAIIYGHPELNIPRVLFLGLGKKEDFCVETLRLAVGKALQKCRELRLSSVLLPLSILDLLPCGRNRLVEEMVYAANLGLYQGNWLKQKDEAAPKDPERFSLAAKTLPQDIRNAAQRGENASWATLLARKLANTPANLLSPAKLAAQAQSLAEASGLGCHVLDEQAMQDIGMGALLSVGQGSVNPPRLVVLEHAPNAQAQEPPLVFVGKGICFDSGGISLKPAAKMHQMKSDMSGAAAVLAAMNVVARENLPKHIVGIMACAENMPGGAAVKPGDVVYAMNGESIEITNTDAEGRMVLADALCYAMQHYSPAILVDIATLTGACAVALGDELAGLFSDDSPLVEHIRAAGQTAGENFWHLPLWKNYEKKLQSEIADICHTGPREGGAINAALFLRHFAGQVRYAHLDIAGVDWQEKASSLCPKGATGFGARTLIELARGGLQ
ncbi:MAG: leucyl aminopeptidase [Desulfovibrio sp.]|nr:leucyl aminopeptidase [Desulfovibrio sp.]